MLIYYNETGSVTFTLSGDDPEKGPQGACIVMPDIDLGELTAWRVVDGNLVLADMGPMRHDAKERVVHWIEELLARFTAGYPSQEVLGWSAKLDGARRVMQGDMTSPTTQAILLEAQIRGIPPEALAAKVIEKGAPYEAIISMTSVVRGDTFTAIEAAETPTQIDAALSAAMTRAATELAKFGVQL